MEKELKDKSEENIISVIETEDILKNIDCEKLADLLSNEQFIGKFMKSLSKRNSDSKESEESLSQREMALPDLHDILENV
jgi:hypothetical protein